MRSTIDFKKNAYLLTIHDLRSATTRSEKLQIREEKAKNGPVALIKLAFILLKPINLKTYARHFEEECSCNYILRLRASSYKPGNRAGSVTGTNSVVCSYGKFQPGRPG